MRVTIPLLAIVAVLCASTVVVLSEDNGEQKHWALLIAGSNSWINYRHQADVCHAYQVVRKHGIPDERIVVMMYDDIAHNYANPNPGVIINKPDGPNVYPGVLKDYTGTDITPEVFLKVLTGDEAGVEQLLGRKGKVIKSGPNDTVFLNFVDHGAPGLVGFPNGATLYAKQLIDAIEYMHKNNQYKEMVVYIEACESGSMFQGLLRKDINVFATTASNSQESSWGCYCKNELNTCLGDLYSVNWMEDSDAEKLSAETLSKQFEIVKKKTTRSHVMKFGDMSMETRVVGEFQGNDTDKTYKERSYPDSEDPNLSAVRADEIEMYFLKRKLLAAKTIEETESHRSAIRNVLVRDEKTKRLFKRIVRFTTPTDYNTLLEKSVDLSNASCYMKSVDSLIEKCPGLDLTNSYFAMKQLRVLANACTSGVKTERMLSAIEMVTARSTICLL